MDAQRCLEILREVKDVAFATVDEKGLPQVRMIDVMIVENEKMYFCTARGKDFYCQIELLTNPPNFVNVTRYHDKNLAKIAEIFQRKRSWFPMPWPLSSF